MYNDPTYNDVQLRLECLRLANGDTVEAQRMYDFVISGSPSLKPAK